MQFICGTFNRVRHHEPGQTPARPLFAIRGIRWKQINTKIHRMLPIHLKCQQRKIVLSFSSYLPHSVCVCVCSRLPAAARHTLLSLRYFIGKLWFEYKRAIDTIWWWFWFCCERAVYFTFLCFQTIKTRKETCATDDVIKFRFFFLFGKCGSVRLAIQILNYMTSRFAQ